jgi:hypothetical protein
VQKKRKVKKEITKKREIQVQPERVEPIRFVPDSTSRRASPADRPFLFLSLASKIKRQPQKRERREGGSPGLLDACHAATLLVGHRANLRPDFFSNQTLLSAPFFISTLLVLCCCTHTQQHLIVFSTIIQLCNYCLIVLILQLSAAFPKLHNVLRRPDFVSPGNRSSNLS